MLLLTHNTQTVMYTQTHTEQMTDTLQLAREVPGLTVHPSLNWIQKSAPSLGKYPVPWNTVLLPSGPTAVYIYMSGNDIVSSLRYAASHHEHIVATRTLTADGIDVAAEITWGQLNSEVGLLSEFLEQMPALQRGDRLGVLGSNCATYIQLLYACADVGIVIVPLNTRWSQDELRHAIRDCGIKVMALPDDNFLSAALELSSTTATGPGISWLLLSPQGAGSPSMPAGITEASQWRSLHVGEEGNMCDPCSVEWRTPDVIDRGGDLKDERDPLYLVPVDEAESPGRLRHEADDAKDVFCIVHTSGSTGRSKGVSLTHQGQVLQAVAKCIHIGFDSTTTFLSVLPLFHVGGISSTLAVTMVAGCHVFLNRFTAASGVAAVQAGRVNSLVLVPTMLHMIIKQAHQTTASASDDSLPLGGVKTVVIGGQSMARELEGSARKSMPNAKFVQTYACTEAGSTVVFACIPHHLGGSTCEVAVAGDSDEDLALRSTGGAPPEHVELRVVERGLHNTSPVPLATLGVVGEVETRGPHVMKGYWGKPEQTAAALRPDGWLRTGDLGFLEKRTGRLVIVGRTKDVIKTGGENVHASEVENVLMRHDWVAEAAAYGVEDERLGELVVASVVLADAVREEAGGVSRDRIETVLSGFCGQHLTGYKRPRRIDVVSALPKNSSGKVMRYRLRSSL